MIDTIEAFLAGLDERLEKGAREHGGQSFLRPVASLVDELRQELLDEVGWAYVLWCAASRKAWGPMAENVLRQRFRDDLRHRLSRNDRGAPQQLPGSSAAAAMCDLEILCLDVFEHAQRMERRLQPIARAIEVAQAFEPYRGRRGGTRDPRSDD